MARVFGAELFGPAGFRKQVALKVVKSEMIAETEGGEAEAFIREARLGGLLKHPSIVDVYELGEAEGQLFISMELVKGVTLSDIIRPGMRPPPAVVLEIAVGIASGLASAHSLVAEGLKAGLVHRDLKPSNVLVSWDGAVKVMDFGIATTVHGEFAGQGQAFSEGRGTPSYMSPEQLLLEPVDGRSDLYALGLLLIELVVGEFLPRKALYNHLVSGGGRSAPVVGEQWLSDVDGAVAGLRPIIERCLKPFASERYASADALLVELESLRAKIGLQSVLRHWLGTMFRTPASGVSTEPHGASMSTQPVGISDADTAVLEPPAPKGSDRPRTNLGPPLDEFVGRAHEYEALAEQFASGARLVTLKGMGGTGKTRLARQFARTVVDDLEGGVWFVDLSEAQTLQELVNATAMTMGVALRGDDLSEMIELLGHAISGHGPSLFVFDNLEQVVGSAADSLGRWMTMASESRFLVTSREALRLTGEHVYSLQPLNEDEGAALFELRAQAAGAQWKDSPETKEAIHGIVRQLDCLPLAIELAAARARMLPPQQLLGRLTDRFKLLRGGRRGASDRQASLHGLIDWSWQLLEPWEKAAWAQLSVFQGGFFMEAAEAVLDLSEWPQAPWSLDVVGSLLDKSLLYGREVDGQPRFGMYSSIQEYAKQKLGGDALATMVRHAEHYAGMHEDAFADERASVHGVNTSKYLGLERDNLVCAVHGALQGGSLEVAARCAMAASDSFKLHGPYADGIALLNRIRTEAISEPSLARVHRKMGLLLQHLAGKQSETTHYFERALEGFRALGERQNSAVTMMNLAAFIVRKGQFEQAQAYYDEALAVFQEMKVRQVEGVCLGNIATLYRRLGRHHDALEVMNKALAISREIGDRSSECVQLTNLSNVLKEEGQVDRGKACAELAISIARELDNRYFETVNLGNLAGYYEGDGLWSEALEFRRESLRISRELGNRLTEAICLGNMGNIFEQQGDLDAAESHVRQSIAITDGEWGVPTGAFRASLAVIRAKKGELDEARALFESAESLLKGAHMPGYLEVLCKKAQIEHEAGHHNEATRALAEAESILSDLGLGPNSQMAGWVAEARATIAGSQD